VASGNTLVSFRATANQPPASAYATPDTRNSHPVLDFDASAVEYAIFGFVLPSHYSGGGLTVRLGWGASTATSGDVVWTSEIERINASTLDIDADSFASAQTATGTAPGTSGQIIYTSVAHTSGANMDSLAVGEAARIRIGRNATSGSDTMTGDAELLSVEILEA
jgi:hypothetical protein